MSQLSISKNLPLLAAHDGVIGSSINGRLETSIGVSLGLTTISMPMKGSLHPFLTTSLIIIKIIVACTGEQPDLRSRIGTKGKEI